MADPGELPALDVGEARITVTGELGFATVTPLIDVGRHAIAGTKGPRVILDLGGVTKADSAGLALVVDWLRTARGCGRDLELHGVPAQLAAIGRVCGLESVLDAGAAHAS